MELTRILRRGCVGPDVEAMQVQFNAIGRKCEIDGIYGEETERVVKAYQRDVFGEKEADGAVGPKTWGKLFENSKKPVNKGRFELKCERTSEKDYAGCYLLKLSLVGDGGKIVDTVQAVSGQSWAQWFRTGDESKSGSYEPLPQGNYTVGHPDWANGQGNYSASWGDGLGPVVWDLKPTFWTERASLLIHLDANRGNSPGTAGCIGLLSLADLRKVVSWFNDSSKAPQKLWVNWDL